MAEASVRPKDVIEGVIDELECPICNEHFQKPKYLHCMHTFCEGCLQDLANSMKPKKTLPCPLCRQETPIPKQGISGGLKNNHMASSILERINSNAASGGAGDAKSLHKDTCVTHQDQILNYYCRTCRNPVCRECCIVDHCRPDHDVCKVQDVTGEKKAAMKDIVAEVRSMLDECRIQTEHTEEVKAKFMSSMGKAREDLNKRSEAMLGRVTSRVEAADDALEKVHQSRSTMFKKKEAELQIRKNCLMQLLRDAENLLGGSDATVVGNTAAVISQIKSSLRKMERKPDLDPSVGFVEFGTASASTAAANAEVGEVYEDTKWVMYARTRNKLEFSEARGVDIFENGSIVIADNSGEYPGFITIIDAVDVESCFLVDEQGCFLQSNKDFDTFADVKSIEIDGCAKDVIALPVFHNDVTCSTCNKCPLIGSKFTCLECKDFHVCSECITWNAHVGHPFTVTNYPFLYSPVVGMVSDQCEFNLYRADHGGCCVSKMPFSNNRPWADRRPQSNGPQMQLWSIARDPSLGQIFVSEASQNRIYQYALDRNNTGNGLHMSLTPLFQIETEIKPFFIAVNRHQRQIAVSNWKACRVDVVNYWSHLQYSITTKGDGQRLRPNGVCFDGMDTLYIVHRNTKTMTYGEVHRYNALDGSYVGVAITGLYKPAGIGIQNGKMVVADCHEVKIFKRKVVAGKVKEEPEGVRFVSLPDKILKNPKKK